MRGSGLLLDDEEIDDGGRRPMELVDVLDERDEESEDDDATDDEAGPRARVGTDRRTRPVLSKFERAKVLALRAEQIDRGLQPLVERLDGDGALDTAEREFAAGRLPFIIRRYLADGSCEDWKLSELGPCDRRLSHHPE